MKNGFAGNQSFTNRWIAGFVAATFLFTNHFTLPVAQAYVGAIHELPLREFPANLSSISISREIGTIQEIFKGNSRQTVILIQDAHAIPDAQRNIQKLIEHFQKQYGINQVAVEGAASELDPQIFRSFPDKDSLKKTFEEYFERGEVAGSTEAAIFGPPSIHYQGLEDWALYEEGIGLYLKALNVGAMHELPLRLKFWKSDLAKRKQEVYSKELWQIDQALENFHENQSDLLKVSRVLKEIGDRHKQNMRACPLFLKSLLEESDSPEIEAEVKKIAEEVKKRLSAPQFNQKCQAFQTSQISAAEFALYLKEKFDFVHFSSQLNHLISNQKHLREIEGTQLFKEFEDYAKSVKESLFQNEEQRWRDQEDRRLYLLEKLFKLELSRDEWEEIKKLNVGAQLIAPSEGVMSATHSWRTRRRVSGGNHAPTEMFQPHFAFYRNAEKRDGVFFKNLLQLLSAKRSPLHATLFIAGGFHSQGLSQRLKRAGISYALVMPKIQSLPEVNHYAEQMRGEVSWKNYFKVENGKVNLYSAFVRALRDRLLRNDSRLLKSWRDQIVRDLAEKEEITKSGEYTKYLDEVTPKKIEGSGTSHLPIKQWQANIERFIAGLKHLHAANQITEQNILKLLRPATAQVLVDGPADLAPKSLADPSLIPSIRRLTDRSNRFQGSALETFHSTMSEEKTQSPRSEARTPLNEDQRLDYIFARAFQKLKNFEEDDLRVLTLIQNAFKEESGIITREYLEAIPPIQVGSLLKNPQPQKLRGQRYLINPKDSAANIQKLLKSVGVEKENINFALIRAIGHALEGSIYYPLLEILKISPDTGEFRNPEFVRLIRKTLTEGEKAPLILNLQDETLTRRSEVRNFEVVGNSEFLSSSLLAELTLKPILSNKDQATGRAWVIDFHIQADSIGLAETPGIFGKTLNYRILYRNASNSIGTSGGQIKLKLTREGTLEKVDFSGLAVPRFNLEWEEELFKNWLRERIGEPLDRTNQNLLPPSVEAAVPAVSETKQDEIQPTADLAVTANDASSLQVGNVENGNAASPSVHKIAEDAKQIQKREMGQWAHQLLHRLRRAKNRGDITNQESLNQFLTEQFASKTTTLEDLQNFDSEAVKGLLKEIDRLRTQFLRRSQITSNQPKSDRQKGKQFPSRNKKLFPDSRSEVRDKTDLVALFTQLRNSPEWQKRIRVTRLEFEFDSSEPVWVQGTILPSSFESVMEELVKNAWDAHQRSSRTQVPIRIRLEKETSEGFPKINLSIENETPVAWDELRRIALENSIYQDEVGDYLVGESPDRQEHLEGLRLVSQDGLRRMSNKDLLFISGLSTKENRFAGIGLNKVRKIVRDEWNAGFDIQVGEKTKIFLQFDSGQSVSLSREEVILRLENLTADWLGQNTIPGEALTQKKMAELVHFLGIDHRELISRLIHDFNDLTVYPERPMIKLGGRNVQPTIWILGWRKIKRTVRDSDGTIRTVFSYDRTPIHNHGFSKAEVYVAQGDISEHHFRAVPGQAVGKYESRLARQGSTMNIWTPYIHDMGFPIDEQETEFKGEEEAAAPVVEDWAASIHLYSPSLTLMNYYKIDGNGILQDAGNWVDDESLTEMSRNLGRIFPWIASLDTQSKSKFLQTLAYCFTVLFRKGLSEEAIKQRIQEVLQKVSDDQVSDPIQSFSDLIAGEDQAVANQRSEVRVKGAVEQSGKLYIDRLREMNPNPQVSEGDLSEVNFTIPFRYLDLFSRLLEIKEGYSSGMKVVVMGPGVKSVGQVVIDKNLKSEKIFSPQMVEILAALHDKNAQYTVIDKHQSILDAAQTPDIYEFVPSGDERQRLFENPDLFQAVTDSLASLMPSIPADEINFYGVYPLAVPNKGIHTFRADFEALDYGEEEVDLIVSTLALTYALKKIETLEERIGFILKLIRALKSGGKLLVQSNEFSSVWPDELRQKTRSLLRPEPEIEKYIPKFIEILRRGGADVDIKIIGNIMEITKLRSEVRTSSVMGLREFFEQKEQGARARAQQDSLFKEMMERKATIPLSKKIEVLKKISEKGLSFSTLEYWRFLDLKRSKVPERFVRDGFIYLFRGDYPGRRLRGIFSSYYSRWNMTLDQYLKATETEEPQSHANFHARNILETEMWQHGLGGNGPFIGTTASFEIAARHPAFGGIQRKRVYVLRIPEGRAFYNYANAAVAGGGSEEEFLIPDYVTPDEILISINPEAVINKNFTIEDYLKLHPEILHLRSEVRSEFEDNVRQQIKNLSSHLRNPGMVGLQNWVMQALDRFVVGEFKEAKNRLENLRKNLPPGTGIEEKDFSRIFTGLDQLVKFKAQRPAEPPSQYVHVQKQRPAGFKPDSELEELLKFISETPNLFKPKKEKSLKGALLVLEEALALWDPRDIAVKLGEFRTYYYGDLNQNYSKGQEAIARFNRIQKKYVERSIASQSEVHPQEIEPKEIKTIQSSISLEGTPPATLENLRKLILDFPDTFELTEGGRTFRKDALQILEAAQARQEFSAVKQALGLLRKPFALGINSKTVHGRSAQELLTTLREIYEKPTAAAFVPLPDLQPDEKPLLQAAVTKILDLLKPVFNSLQMGDFSTRMRVEVSVNNASNPGQPRTFEVKFSMDGKKAVIKVGAESVRTRLLFEKITPADAGEIQKINQHPLGFGPWIAEINNRLRSEVRHDDNIPIVISTEQALELVKQAPVQHYSIKPYRKLYAQTFTYFRGVKGSVGLEGVLERGMIRGGWHGSWTTWTPHFKSYTHNEGAVFYTHSYNGPSPDESTPPPITHQVGVIFEITDDVVKQYEDHKIYGVWKRLKPFPVKELNRVWLVYLEKGVDMGRMVEVKLPGMRGTFKYYLNELEAIVAEGTKDGRHHKKTVGLAQHLIPQFKENPGDKAIAERVHHLVAVDQYATFLKRVLQARHGTYVPEFVNEAKELSSLIESNPEDPVISAAASRWSEDSRSEVRNLEEMQQRLHQVFDKSMSSILAAAMSSKQEREFQFTREFVAHLESVLPDSDFILGHRLLSVSPQTYLEAVVIKLVIEGDYQSVIDFFKWAVEIEASRFPQRVQIIYDSFFLSLYFAAQLMNPNTVKASETSRRPFFDFAAQKLFKSRPPQKPEKGRKGRAKKDEGSSFKVNVDLNSAFHLMAGRIAILRGEEKYVQALILVDNVLRAFKTHEITNGNDVDQLQTLKLEIEKERGVSRSETRALNPPLKRHPEFPWPSQQEILFHNEVALEVEADPPGATATTAKGSYIRLLTNKGSRNLYYIYNHTTDVPITRVNPDGTRTPLDYTNPSSQTFHEHQTALSLFDFLMSFWDQNPAIDWYNARILAGHVTHPRHYQIITDYTKDFVYLQINESGFFRIPRQEPHNVHVLMGPTRSNPGQPIQWAETMSSAGISGPLQGKALVNAMLIAQQVRRILVLNLQDLGFQIPFDENALQTVLRQLPTPRSEVRVASPSPVLIEYWDRLFLDGLKIQYFNKVRSGKLARAVLKEVAQKDREIRSGARGAVKGTPQKAQREKDLPQIILLSALAGHAVYDEIQGLLESLRESNPDWDEQQLKKEIKSRLKEETFVAFIRSRQAKMLDQFDPVRRNVFEDLLDFYISSEPYPAEPYAKWIQAQLDFYTFFHVWMKEAFEKSSENLAALDHVIENYFSRSEVRTSDRYLSDEAKQELELLGNRLESAPQGAIYYYTYQGPTSGYNPFIHGKPYYSFIYKESEDSPQETEYNIRFNDLDQIVITIMRRRPRGGSPESQGTIILTRFNRDYDFIRRLLYTKRRSEVRANRAKEKSSEEQRSELRHVFSHVVRALGGITGFAEQEAIAAETSRLFAQGITLPEFVNGIRDAARSEMRRLAAAPAGENFNAVNFDRATQDLMTLLAQYAQKNSLDQKTTLVLDVPEGSTDADFLYFGHLRALKNFLNALIAHGPIRGGLQMKLKALYRQLELTPRQIGSLEQLKPDDSTIIPTATAGEQLQTSNPHIFSIGLRQEGVQDIRVRKYAALVQIAYLLMTGIRLSRSEQRKTKPEEIKAELLSAMSALFGTQTGNILNLSGNHGFVSVSAVAAFLEGKYRSELRLRQSA